MQLQNASILGILIPIVSEHYINMILTVLYGRTKRP